MFKMINMVNCQKKIRIKECNNVHIIKKVENPFPPCIHIFDTCITLLAANATLLCALITNCVM